MTKQPEYYIFLSSVTGDVRYITKSQYDLTPHLIEKYSRSFNNQDYGKFLNDLLVNHPERVEDVIALDGYKLDSYKVALLPKTDERPRCEFELYVEKYFGLSPSATDEKTVIPADFGVFCDLLCGFKQELEKQELKETPITEEELGAFIYNNNNDFGDFRNNCDSIAMTIMEHFDIKRKKP